MMKKIITKKLLASVTVVSLLLAVCSVALADGYLLNTKSGKFHYSHCRTIKNPNAAHFVPVGSREEAVAQGYAPCKVCNP